MALPNAAGREMDDAHDRPGHRPLRAAAGEFLPQQPAHGAGDGGQIGLVGERRDAGAASGVGGAAVLSYD